MIFKTESGSYYEVEDQRLRRLCGPPAKHRASDGEWREFEAILKLEVGSGAVFVWPDRGDGVIRTLITNMVIEVSE
jgi:hypothetical protein